TLRRVFSGVWLPAEEVIAFTSSQGGEGENEGDRVIMTRIAINNNGQCHCGSL
ncbi:hypothetical protein SEEM841_08032, partial [Salmonella enterica subsp. enterica serovar Senftenberg str. 423984-1]